MGSLGETSIFANPAIHVAGVSFAYKLIAENTDEMAKSLMESVTQFLGETTKIMLSILPLLLNASLTLYGKPFGTEVKSLRVIVAKFTSLQPSLVTFAIWGAFLLDIPILFRRSQVKGV